jgi:hypothetical protein
LDPGIESAKERKLVAGQTGSLKDFPQSLQHPIGIPIPIESDIDHHLAKMCDHGFDFFGRGDLTMTASGILFLEIQRGKHYGSGVAQVQSGKIRTGIQCAQVGAKFDLLREQAEILSSEHQGDFSVQTPSQFFEFDRAAPVFSVPGCETDYKLTIPDRICQRWEYRKTIQPGQGTPCSHPLSDPLTPFALGRDEPRLGNLEVFKQAGERSDIFRDFGSDEQGSEPFESV